MRKGLLAVCLAALAVALVLPSRAHAVQAEVRLAPMGRSYSPPALGRKQGWLTVSNRDWQEYTLVVGPNDRMFLYQGGRGYGGIVIPSGATITLAVEKDNYRLYGNNEDKLRVRVREGRTTTLSLEPFGYVGNTGLRGVVNDGDKVRNEVLFDNYYEAPVIVQTPPPVIINRPPPPPPVIINRPPVVVNRPPSHRPPAYRPPAHRPPSHRPPSRPGHKDDGWGFTFSFGNRK